MDVVESLDDLEDEAKKIMEAEAKKRAIKYVSNILQTPDKLDNIKQLKINVTRKKASVETALKTAVQKQLEGNFLDYVFNFNSNDSCFVDMYISNEKIVCRI